MIKLLETMSIPTKLQVIKHNAISRQQLDEKMLIGDHHDTISYFIDFFIELYQKENEKVAEILHLFCGNITSHMIISKLPIASCANSWGEYAKHADLLNELLLKNWIDVSGKNTLKQYLDFNPCETLDNAIDAIIGFSTRKLITEINLNILSSRFDIIDIKKELYLRNVFFVNVYDMSDTTIYVISIPTDLTAGKMNLSITDIINPITFLLGSYHVYNNFCNFMDKMELAAYIEISNRDLYNFIYNLSKQTNVSPEYMKNAIGAGIILIGTTVVQGYMHARYKIQQTEINRSQISNVCRSFEHWLSEMNMICSQKNLPEMDMYFKN